MLERAYLVCPWLKRRIELEFSETFECGANSQQYYNFLLIILTISELFTSSAKHAIFSIDAIFPPLTVKLRPWSQQFPLISDYCLTLSIAATINRRLSHIIQLNFTKANGK
jgi:hypothetical protein